MADSKRTGKKKKKRTAIVPRAVFAASVVLGTVPALPGCGSSTVVDAGPGDAGRPDLPFAVAVPIDLGPDQGPSDLGSPDAGMDAGTDSGVFAVAVPIDLGPSDAPALDDSPIFAVAVPFDM